MSNRDRRPSTTRRQSADRTGRRRAGRGGSASVEFLLLMPLLFGIVLALVQFSMTIAAQHALAMAAREGAREAATGGTEQEVKNTVKRFLGEGRLSCAEVKVELTNPSGQPIPSGEPVTVTVSIATDQAAPNFLAILGFGPPQQTLCARTVMRKE